MTRSTGSGQLLSVTRGSVPAQRNAPSARWKGVTDRRAQVARNEAFFRAVNEGIAEASERFESPEAEFLCECGDARCTHRIEVPLEEYESVREHPARFLVRRGHQEPEVEEVVKRGRRYAIVEKVDRIAAAVVGRLNPRATGTAESRSD